MNAEMAARRPIARRMAERIAGRASAPGWRMRVLRLALAALATGGAAQVVFAQDPGLLDARVTQKSVAETICRQGYADNVAPPFDQTMALKERMLAARGCTKQSLLPWVARWGVLLPFLRSWLRASFGTMRNGWLMPGY